MFPTIAAATFRVASIAIKGKCGRSIASATYIDDEILWGALDHCVVPTEHRTRVRVACDNIPAGLWKIDIDLLFEKPPGKASIISPLATEYAALLHSLHVLVIKYSDHDECAALYEFAKVATNLRELTFFEASLTSVRGLEGCCDSLRKVSLSRCKSLTNIDGLGDRLFLQEVNLSCTDITNIDPLRTCPALRIVNLEACDELSSIEALAFHQWLEEVDASYTAISTIEPLRSCPALTTVFLIGCPQLQSIDGLEGHQKLHMVNVGWTGITSIEPLRTCPALTAVDLGNCEEISSIEALGGHLLLEEVEASCTAMTSIEPLRTCPNLTKVNILCCKALSSIDALESHQRLQEVNMSWTPIKSIESLRSCPALRRVVVSATKLPLDVAMPTTVHVIR